MTDVTNDSKADSTMTTVSIDNFGKQNTPPIIEKIGNTCLLIGAIGAVVAATAPASIPIIAVIGTWSAVIGAVGKVITKFAGTKSLTE